MVASNEELYANALDMARDVKDTFIDLGRSLRKLQDRDPELFHKVVDRSGLGRRKAYYMVELARTFEKFPVPKARLRAIGWTKLMIVAKSITADNLEELLHACETMTAAQLQAMMKGEEPKTNAHCVLMYFTPKQFAELEEHLIKNGGERAGRGILNKEEALLRALRKGKPNGNNAGA